MKRKINVLIVTLMFCLTALVVVPDNAVRATEPEIDNDYIKSVAKKLSWVIFDAPYNNSELKKGRAFGTKGEHYAAQYLADEMEYNLSLFDPTSNPNLPYREQIQNIPSKLDRYTPSINLTDKLEVLSLGITVNDEVNVTNITIVDCNIRPMWNLRTFLAMLERIFKKLDERLDWLESVLKIDTSDNYYYNMIFNQSWLTKNVSYGNLPLEHIPTNTSWFNEVFYNKTQEIIDNESIVDYPSFLHYFLPAFQEYYKEYNFTFGEVNETNAGNQLPWFDSQWNSSTIGEDEDFVYICEAGFANPNAPFIYPKTQELLDWIDAHFHGLKKSIIKGIIENARESIEILLWNLTMPHCKGLIKYDFHSDTYDMNRDPY